MIVRCNSTASTCCSTSSSSTSSNTTNTSTTNLCELLNFSTKSDYGVIVFPRKCGFKKKHKKEKEIKKRVLIKSEIKLQHYCC